jgi:predicted dehydrogenase
MSNLPVEVILCGAGSRGRTVYGQFALDNPELAKVVAVADPLAERRNAVATEHGLDSSRVFSRWQEIDFSAPLAQAAIVATDDRDHVEPALAFLQSGYHLLLEKPMAPNLQDCLRIVEAADQATGLTAVSHVMRYTPYFRRLKELIDGDAVGRVVTIRHFEPVNYWHFAHSFVRGNWRNSTNGSPFILAKCCHDMDILLFLMGDTPTAVHSFGDLSYFQPGSAPPGATKRCIDCELVSSCAYSAPKFYGRMLAQGLHDWPLDVVISNFQEAALEKEMTEGPYGRCVYHCDNNVPDHQVVNLEFESGATASLVATAFTECPARETDVMGSLGMLRGNGESILHKDFRNGEETVHKVESSGNHMGGDRGLLLEFFQAVSRNCGKGLSSTPRVSLLSHKMALLAEVSRREGRVVSL